jgi:hypothetical protein
MSVYALLLLQWFGVPVEWFFPPTEPVPAGSQALGVSEEYRGGRAPSAATRRADDPIRGATYKAASEQPVDDISNGF